MQTAYYRRSGHITLTTPLWLVLLSGPLVALISAVYALFIYVNPFIEISFLATIGFGILVSASAETALRVGKSRPLLFDLSGTTALALFALWCSWLVWIALSFANGLIVASHMITAGPDKWFAFLVWLAQHDHETVARYFGSGTSFSAATPTELFEQWGGEALLTVGTAILGTLANKKDRIFSEKTRRWARRSLRCEAVGPQDIPKDVRASLERSDYSVLERLDLPDVGEPQSSTASWRCFEVTLLTHPNDTGICALQLDAVTSKLNAKGKIRKNHEMIVENLLLPFDVYTALVGRLTVVPVASP